MKSNQGNDFLKLLAPLGVKVCDSSIYDEYFKKLIEERNSLEKFRREKAKKFFETFLSCNFENTKPMIHIGETGKLSISNPEEVNLNASLAENIDYCTISYFIEFILNNERSARQSAAAIKRHAENYAMKADVFNWLDKNMNRFSSMDKAAEAVRDKVAPIAFRTARKWVGEYKKINSAGKV